MAKDTQNTKPQQQTTKVDMVDNPGPVDEIFVDGIAGVMARGGVVKFDLYRVIGADPEARTERRQISHRLVVPQSALPELARLLQQVLRAAQQQTQAAAEGKDSAESKDSAAAKGKDSVVDSGIMTSDPVV